ncbi:molecular chaperone TorD family protein [Eggerthella sp. NSJ-70]|uniref:Molecular chaperone TorD family protein n=1 Tax=Eggerthella hominis TaxID=2763043 RepID=A0ABR7BT99_9ACTN|nr:molecular chaperone TorD family protein [Eggerthella hominis]MBC5584838.1 molecular chaperone TorD family protein [Eggerthella hominis]
MEERAIEALGMRLANRAYLYRIFHIAFGAEPSKEELSVLGSKETIDAAQYLADTCGSEALLDVVRLFSSFASKAADGAYVESMRSDFAKLFLVPGASYVHPWESPYIGKEAMLFQESTLDVRHRYAEYDFVAMEFGHFPEDHVSMMLDFLAHLSSRAFDAFEAGRDDEVKRILASQRDFVTAHLLNWLADFHAALCDKDEAGTYRRFASALRAFLALDEGFAESALAELDAMEQEC